MAVSLPVPVGAASENVLPPGTRDISSTPLGSQLITGAKDRLAARGITANLRVVEDDAGYTVAPADTSFVGVAVTLPDGTTGTSAMPVTAPKAATASSVVESAQFAAAAAPSWVFQTANCFARINHAFAWMDHCYAIYKMSSDGSSTRDYYALQHYASMGNNAPWTLGWGYLQAYRLSGTTAQNWVDWSPKGGYNGSCSSAQLAVVFMAVGLVYNVEKCERWIMTKQNPAVDYKLEWIGPGTRDTRELAFEIAVWVNQGAWPQWVVPADADGGLA